MEIEKIISLVISIISLLLFGNKEFVKHKRVGYKEPYNKYYLDFYYRLFLNIIIIFVLVKANAYFANRFNAIETTVYMYELIILIVMYMMLSNKKKSLNWYLIVVSIIFINMLIYYIIDFYNQREWMSFIIILVYVFVLTTTLKSSVQLMIIKYNCYKTIYFEIFLNNGERFEAISLYENKNSYILELNESIRKNEFIVNTNKLQKVKRKKNDYLTVKKSELLYFTTRTINYQYGKKRKINQE